MVRPGLIPRLRPTPIRRRCTHCGSRTRGDERPPRPAQAEPRCAVARPNALEGVGACEAPRGTLFHHYKIDEQGLIRWVNLVIATGHNNLAMNRSVLQVAKHFVQGNRLNHGMLNRVELSFAVTIRA
jgi:coenzyme F420-reducing hydrogenase alpha subunit